MANLKKNDKSNSKYLINKNNKLTNIKNLANRKLMESKENLYKQLQDDDLQNPAIKKKAKKLIERYSEKQNPIEQSCCLSSILLSWVAP